MGLAAIHHKKAGHCTMVELTYSQIFGEYLKDRPKV